MDSKLEELMRKAIGEELNCFAVNQTFDVNRCIKKVTTGLMEAKIMEQLTDQWQPWTNIAHAINGDENAVFDTLSSMCFDNKVESRHTYLIHAFDYRLKK